MENLKHEEMLGNNAIDFSQPNVMIRRKWRWLAELTKKDGTVILPSTFIKPNSRPSFNFEETELNYLNGYKKLSWEEIEISFYDEKPSKLQPLFSHLNDQGVPAEKMDCVIQLLDGCGSLLEKWILSNCIITKVNFGDYSSSDITLTLRYEEVKYESAPLPKVNPNPTSFSTSMGLGLLGDVVLR